MVFEELFNIEYSFNKPGLTKQKYNKNIVKWNNEKKICQSSSIINFKTFQVFPFLSVDSPQYNMTMSSFLSIYYQKNYQYIKQNHKKTQGITPFGIQITLGLTQPHSCCSPPFTKIIINALNSHLKYKAFPPWFRIFLLG